MSAERFEYKYPLPCATYCGLAAALRIHTRHDAISLRHPSQRYFVRSLYFDTSDFRAYAEKITGERNRIKLRIRSYESKQSQAGFVSVELKTREGALVRKFGTRISLERYRHFERTRRFASDDPVLLEFERLLRLGAQRPVMLVDYRREALVPRDRGDVRITIDHDIRFARSTELFPATAFFRSRAPYTLLEIKTAGASPAWLESLVRRFGLRSSPHSKYALGIEQTQHAISFPR